MRYIVLVGLSVAVMIFFPVLGVLLGVVTVIMLPIFLVWCGFSAIYSFARAQRKNPYIGLAEFYEEQVIGRKPAKPEQPKPPSEVH